MMALINNSNQTVWPSPAIPIINKSHYRNINSNSDDNQQTSYQTTPSLQSILDQKKLSNGSIRSNVSTSSVPSLSSLSSASYESCDSHPLDSFNTWEDIDENFFNNEFNESIDYDLYDKDCSCNFEPVSPIQETKKIIDKKSSFVSNLSSSIRSFTNATMHNNDILMDIQPRLTDDKLPRPIIRRLSQDEFLSHQDTELKTFKITSINNTTKLSLPNTQLSSSQVSILRNREPRINSQFLRLYSYESNSRKKGILPEVTYQDEQEYSIRSSTPSDGNSGLSLNPTRDFAIQIRQRLWQCVVLPPRDDLSMTNSKKPEYVYEGNDDEEGEFVSLIRKKGDIKPWIKLEDEQQLKQQVLRPCGVLNNDVQFTVKGWCNERWLANNA